MSAAPEAIDLANLDDATFERLYRERIEPCFAANESERRAAVAQFNRRMASGGALAAAIAVAIFLYFHGVVPALLTGFMVGFFAWLYAQAPLASVGQRLKEQYCAAIAEAMGASFTIKGFEPPALERMKQLRLLPPYARAQFEDLFSGAYRQSHFELYEGCLKQRRTSSKGRTRYVTVFRGQLIRLHFPRNFLGVTIVRRDAGVFNAFGGGELEGRKLAKVGVVSEFERAFEVWGTDQVEARYLLHPTMMARLLDLEKTLHGRRLRCAFQDGDMLIAVEGGNLFEPGDLFKPLVDPVRARRIVDEVAGVMKVMEQVLTAQATR